MTIIEAQFRIVTPMFIGDADQSPNDGIRPPSVKGALRFWWRALQWHHALAEAEGNSCNAMKKLHQREASLFGNAADGNKGGQGRFLLHVTDENLDRNDHQTPPAGYKYLLGQGLSARKCISGGTFSVKFQFRPDVEKPEQEEVVRALMALGLLGSLGSRSRHGMGSIAMEKIVRGGKGTWSAPTTREQYKAEIKALVGSLAGIPQADYSAFANESRIDCLILAKSPNEVLNQFGLKMLDYRSWGRSENRNVLPSGAVSEKRFSDDHKWLRNPAFSTHNPTFHPRRVMFGLPHNYGNTKKVNAAAHERRASPLFFHVHRLSKDEYIGVSTLLKSRFLPDGEQINAGGRLVKAKVDDWAVISDFLDGKVGNPPTKEDRFPDKKPMLP